MSCGIPPLLPPHQRQLLPVPTPSRPRGPPFRPRSRQLKHLQQHLRQVGHVCIPVFLSMVVRDFKPTVENNGSNELVNFLHKLGDLTIGEDHLFLNFSLGSVCRGGSCRTQAVHDRRLRSNHGGASQSSGAGGTAQRYIQLTTEFLNML